MSPKSLEFQNTTLNTIYSSWKTLEKEESTLTWAKWLLENKFVMEAGSVVESVSRELGAGSRKQEAFERQWRAILDGEVDAVDVEGRDQGEDAKMAKDGNSASGDSEGMQDNEGDGDEEDGDEDILIVS